MTVVNAAFMCYLEEAFSQGIAVSTAMSPRLLILDNHLPAAIALSFIAKYHGWVAMTSTSPQEALTLIGDDAVDALLTDYYMPSATGLKVVETLRLDHHSTVPVIMMSARPGMIDRDLARRLDVLTILEKPFDQSLLIRALDQALELVAPRQFHRIQGKDKKADSVL